MYMKKVGIIMSVLMGVTMSFCLSLTNSIVSADKFDMTQFLISFGASAVLSLIIGLIVPMKKVEDGACKAMKLRENSVPAKLVSAFISDIIYTPILTLSMIIIVRKMVMKMSHGHAVLPSFATMFIKSFILSLAVAYIIILIVTPIFLKLSLKLAGVNPAGGPPAEKK
jgi:hypothetical protein